MTKPDNDRIRVALEIDSVIDIVTTGARSGLQRTTEIWFTNVSGRIIICGTPGGTGGSGPRIPRDWLANLVACPDFTFCLKESLEVRLTARATPVSDVGQRRALMSAPETQWYRDQVDSVDDLVQHSPIVDVRFTGEYSWLSPWTRLGQATPRNAAFLEPATQERSLSPRWAAAGTDHPPQ